MREFLIGAPPSGFETLVAFAGFGSADRLRLSLETSEVKDDWESFAMDDVRADSIFVPRRGQETAHEFEEMSGCN